MNDLKQLKPGDIVRHKLSGVAYVVTANNGELGVIAVRTVTLLNPSEWDLEVRDGKGETQDSR